MEPICCTHFKPNHRPGAQFTKTQHVVSDPRDRGQF